jgi:glycosyltransferase involved in cell wall biosynthesis
MKILQLTHKPPVPSIDGGCLAMHQLSSCLLKTGAIVKVVSISTVKHPIVFSDDFIEYRDKTSFESVFINTKVNIFKAISSILRRSSLQADRFFSNEMAQKLKDIFIKETFDVVVLESVFTGNYLETIRNHSQAKIFLRGHNIEHLIWQRLSKQTKNPIKKAAYCYLAASLKRFELSLFEKIDGYLPITEVDSKFFKQLRPNLSSQVVPFGIDLPVYPYQEHKINPHKISLFHIGSMNWQPNKEGMRWFLEHVWKKAVEKHAHLTLVLAGKGNKEFFRNKIYKNVQVFDFVEDAQQFMNKHDIMVAPLLSGSGMRIKIMEGLALGKPIITTTTGAEGIEISNRENIFIADTPEAMLQTIDFCVNNIEKCEEMGKNARKLIENKYAQNIISQQLIEFLSFTQSHSNY